MSTIVKLVGRINHETLTAIVGLLAGVMVLLWDLFISPPAGVTPAMQSVLAVFAFTLAMWLTKAVPFVISGTAAVVLLYALNGVETFQAATVGFASTLVFFLLLLLLIGQSISKVGLDTWVASRLLTSSDGSTAGRPIRSLSSHILALSFAMPSAVARAVTFIPIVRQMSDSYGLSHESDFERTGFLVLGHVNPIASMALMTGGGMAITTSQFIQTEIRPITWLGWALLMIPPVVLLYVLAATTAERLYGSSEELDRAADDGVERNRIEPEGNAASFTRDQRIVTGVLLSTVVLWVIGSFLGVPTIIPALFAVVVLSLPGIGIINSDDVADVSWGILFVIGAMFSILNAMESTGTLEFLVGLLTGIIPFGTFSHWQVIASLLGFAVLIRVFFSTASAAIVVVLPIILELGSTLGVNRFYLALSTLLIVGSTTILPFNTTSVLLSFDRGPLSNTDVAVFGIITGIYAVFVIVLSWLVYWPMVS